MPKPSHSTSSYGRPPAHRPCRSVMSAASLKSFAAEACAMTDS